MKLKGTDTYQLILEGRLDEAGLSSLGLLYPVLLAPSAARLYLFFYAGALIRDLPADHLQICQALDLKIDEVEAARKNLEQIGLIRSLMRQDNQAVSYLYHIYMPKSPEAFLKDPLFSRKYYQLAGADNFRAARDRLGGARPAEDGYIDISEPYHDQAIAKWDDEDEHNYQGTVIDSSLSDLSGYQPDNAFDYPEFLRNLEAVSVPRRVLTEDNLNFIGNTALIYGIDPIRMGILTAKSLMVAKDGSLGELDRSKLSYKCRKEKNILESSTGKSGKYDAAPAVFLRKRQNGVSELAEADARLLSDLVLSWKLPIPVTNVLVEYCLESNNGELNRKQAEKIAASWARAQIKTAEQALIQIGGYAKPYRHKARITEPQPEPKTAAKAVSPQDEELRQRLLREIKGEK